MPGTFYAGQTDYITRMNELYDNFVPVTVSAPSTTANLDLSQGKVFNITLGTAATTTFTITNVPTGYVNVDIAIKQHSGTARSVAFSGTVKWENNTVPTQTQTVSLTDFWNFKTFNAGTTWFARKVSSGHPA